MSTLSFFVREKSMTRRLLFLSFLFTLWLPLSTVSQVLKFDAQHSSISVSKHAVAGDNCTGLSDADDVGLIRFLPNIRGFDYFASHGVKASYSGPASAWIFSQAQFSGDSSETGKIEWWDVSQTDYLGDDCPLGYYAAGHTLHFQVIIRMIIKGDTLGTPVTVLYRLNHFGAGITDHEDVGEDTILSTCSVWLQNDEKIHGRCNFPTLGGFDGWNRLPNDSDSFVALVGDTLELRVESETHAVIQNPPRYNNGWVDDYADAIQTGYIEITVNAPLPPVASSITPRFRFSLDIGSDGEFSDPQKNGNELFDPGDMYPWRCFPLPPINTLGHIDDSLFFMVDPSPNSLHTAAPVGSGQSPDTIAGRYFDLDGFDALDFMLSNCVYGIGLPSISPVASQCVHVPTYLWVSFDDDGANHYVDAAGSVPVNSTSSRGRTYGMVSKRDEVVQLHTSAFPPATFLDLPFSHEEYFHTALAANPDSGGLTENDDIDAIDLFCDSCTIIYFSPDQEAHRGLLPGGIYQVLPGGSIPMLVIDPSYLGLPAGTDINDFDFVWIFDTTANRYGLALLYTVEEDDGLTPSVDESGGFNPAMIYASFLNGTSAPFLASPLQDAIDGITASSTDVIDTSSVNPFMAQTFLSVKKKWNMLSVPLLVQNYQKSSLFPSAISAAFAYQGGYVSKDTLENGAGFWLKFITDEFVSISGYTIPDDTITVSSGWNMIGSISSPVAVVDITSDPPAMITSSFFGYDEGYSTTDTIYPGKGYWVKVTQPGSLILSGSAQKVSGAGITIRNDAGTPPPPPGDILANQNAVPGRFSLRQNYPNPFNPNTKIQYWLPATSVVTLTVYDILGREVVSLLQREEKEPGIHEVSFDASSLPAGVYFYRIHCVPVEMGNYGVYTNVKKIILAK